MFQFLREDNGNFSGIRLAVLLIVLAFVFDYTSYVFANFINVCFLLFDKSHQIKFYSYNPDQQMVEIIAAVILGKVWQKKYEQKVVESKKDLPL